MFTSDIKKRIVVIFVFLAAFNIGIWVWTFAASKNHPLLLGLVFLAYGFGLRHAVDADHLAAIDLTTRKLMQENKKPVAVGFFFSLGHSTIVIVLCALVALSTTFVNQHLSSFQEVGSRIGTLVSSLFLLIIGMINLVVLIDIFKTWKRVIKNKNYDEKIVQARLDDRGFIARLCKPLLKVVTKSWHMYFVGFLFGLGFDTATEIGLLSISAATAAKGMPLWNILLLPLAFTAGMSLIDTIDGVLMLGAYGWAYTKPLRKLYYNMNITLISVIIALFIGGVEGLQLMSLEFGFTGSFFIFINTIALNTLGFFILAAFLVSWGLSVLIYKLRGYDSLDH